MEKNDNMLPLQVIGNIGNFKFEKENQFFFPFLFDM